MPMSRAEDPAAPDTQQRTPDRADDAAHAEPADGVPGAEQDGKHSVVQAAAAPAEPATVSSDQQQHQRQNCSEDDQQAAQRQPPPAGPTANGTLAGKLCDSGDQAMPLPSQSAHWRSHMRSTSGLSESSMASDDFEHTAEPIASGGLSDQVGAAAGSVVAGLFGGSIASSSSPLDSNPACLTVEAC